MNALRVSLAIICLAAAVTVAAFAQGAVGLFTDSDPVGGNTFATDTLDAPTSLGATGGGSVDLSWTATVDTYASGHRVLRSTTSGGPYSQIAEVTPRTTTVYTDSPAAGTYYYVARGFFQNWESVNSNEASATVSASSPVAFDASTWGGSTVASNTVTVSHTTGSITGNSIILALITYDSRNGETVASVTWDTGGGNPTFTLVPGSRFGTSTKAASEIWYALAPAASTTATMTATFQSGETPRGPNVVAMSLDNVDQTTPYDSASGDTSTSASVSTTVSSAADDMVVDVVSDYKGAAVGTVGAGQTLRANGQSYPGDPRNFIMTSTEAGAAPNVNMSWTGLNAVKLIAAQSAVNIRAVGGAATSDAAGILDAWTTGTTHTVSAGTDRLLLVGVYGEDSGSISSVDTVTWGGQTLTEINEVTVGSGYSNLVWMGYLNDAGIAAASGSTIVATWSSGTPDESVLYSAVTLENVDQTTPVDGSSNGTSTSASTVQIAISHSVDTDDMVVYVTGSGAQGEAHTADTGYTEGTEQDSGGVGQVASNATKAITADGSEQPTASWSNTNNRLAIIGAVINVAP